MNDVRGTRVFPFIPLDVYYLRVLGICGSLQAKSGNLALLKTAAGSMPPGVDFVLFDGLRHLPHFNPDIEASGVPESVTQWRSALAASDVVLIASPEYGFSLPGVLKNGIDWVIGSGELEHKVVAITAAVAGPERGRRGLAALRDTLSAARTTIVGGDPIAQGPGVEPQVAALVQALVAAGTEKPLRRCVVATSSGAASRIVR
jgi:chromate reductase, NAD(P)H dehydrogenase (quinone)